MERSSTGFGGHSVLPLGLLAAFAVAAVVVWLVGRRGERRAGASPWLFFTLPLLASSLQELFERLIGAEAAPFEAALDPRFLIGLSLQVAFGPVALLVARVLPRVSRRVLEGLGHGRSVIAAHGLEVFELPLLTRCGGSRRLRSVIRNVGRPRRREWCARLPAGESAVLPSAPNQEVPE